MTDINIIQGDCLDKLSLIPDSSVQMCLTSPPYFNLRDYLTAEWLGGDPTCTHVSDRRHYTMRSATSAGCKESFSEAGPDNAKRLKQARWRERGCCVKCGAQFVDRQIGIEDSPADYVAKIVAVMREVRRVLKPDGVAFLNVGDTFSQGGRGCTTAIQKTNRGTVGSTPFRARGFARKQLLLIPHRLLIALQDDGWIVRNDIIWAKKTVMPESVKDRCTRSHEHVFLLTKSLKYFWNAEAIREPATGRMDRRVRPFGCAPDRRDTDRIVEHDGLIGANARDVWREPPTDVWWLSPKAYPGAHYATMPIALAERCIKAGSRHGDTVLDPFGGVGTSALAADKLGRHAILIELNEDYCRLAADRLRQYGTPDWVSFLPSDASGPMACPSDHTPASDVDIDPPDGADHECGSYDYDGSRTAPTDPHPADNPPPADV